MTQYPRWSASMLRRDLTTRALHHARANALLHDLSTGASPAVLFGCDDQHRPAHHGNFHPAAYAAICAHPEWLRRLTKVHTASRRSSARHDWQWKELDSATSSDALLMNIFCHPGVYDGARLAAPVADLLNVDAAAAPCFGAHPGVPLRTPRRTRARKIAPAHSIALAHLAAPAHSAVILAKPESPYSPYLLDRTEIDLTLGNLFMEAKLTESDFQTAAPALIARYRDLEAVFDLDRLPRKIPVARVPHPSQSHRDGWDEKNSDNPSIDPDLDDSFLTVPARPTRIAGYQLIRNVLAAYAADASFCVLCDARRHDLIDLWYQVLSAVHSPTFATRLKLLTWQELAGTLPSDLQHFLATKYGITP